MNKMANVSLCLQGLSRVQCYSGCPSNRRHTPCLWGGLGDEWCRWDKWRKTPGCIKSNVTCVVQTASTIAIERQDRLCKKRNQRAVSHLERDCKKLFFLSQVSGVNCGSYHPGERLKSRLCDIPHPPWTIPAHSTPRTVYSPHREGNQLWTLECFKIIQNQKAHNFHSQRLSSLCWIMNLPIQVVAILEKTSSMKIWV